MSQRDWVSAPETSRLYRYEDGGHATAFEHFSDFRRIMRSTVVPETYSS